jgi:hypothetical protein
MMPRAHDGGAVARIDSSFGQWSAGMSFANFLEKFPAG